MKYLFSFRISLSKIYDVDGINSVAELFSQAINGTVDVEKNPWIFFIQGNMEVASTLFYLFKAGVPVRDAIFFVSNPLVREYVDNQKRLKSAYGEFTGDAPKNQNFVKYNSAEMVVNKVISQLLRNVVKEHKGDMFVVTQGPFDFKPKVNRMSVEVFIEEVRNGNLEVSLIKRLEKISGSPQTKILYTKPEITSTTYAKSVSNYVNKPNVLKNGVFSSADMEKLVKEPGQENSNLAISMFLHYLEIEKQLKGISTAKSNAKPDTQTFKSPQEILYRDVNIELLANNSKVDPTLMTSLQTDSVLSSLFDKEIIMSMLNPLFKLRDNTLLNDFILSKIRLNADLIKANFGQGKDGASRFIDEYKNAMINFIYQNYMSNIIDSNGKISNRPDDFRGYKVTTNNSQEKDVVINKDAEGIITGISVNYNLIESDYNNNLYLGKNNAVDNSYFKRGLKTFKEADALFPDKTSFIKYVIEREYLRDIYKDTIPAASLEMYLADKALMNTFNRTAIMKDNEHSYTDKIMNIIKNFPQLKAQFPILEQISRVPSKTGDNILTLNDRKIISGSEAQIYVQNIKQLADPNIKKVENNQANKAISDVFGLFPQIMVYQHGVGKSKYGFNSALPVDKYNTIMKYASKVFSDNYMNNNAFQIIFDRLTQVKTPFKSYMLDAEKLSEAGNRRLSPEALKLANEVAPGFIQSSYDEDQIIEFFDELSKIDEPLESTKETADGAREFLKDFLKKYPQYNEKTKIKERKTANFAIAQILIYNELLKEQSEIDEEQAPTPGTQLSLFGEEPTQPTETSKTFVPDLKKINQVKSESISNVKEMSFDELGTFTFTVGESEYQVSPKKNDAGDIKFNIYKYDDNTKLYNLVSNPKTRRSLSTKEASDFLSKNLPEDFIKFVINLYNNRKEVNLNLPSKREATKLNPNPIATQASSLMDSYLYQKPMREQTYDGSDFPILLTLEEVNKKFEEYYSDELRSGIKKYLEPFAKDQLIKSIEAEEEKLNIFNERGSTNPAKISKMFIEDLKNALKNFVSTQPTVRKTYSGKVTSLQPNQIFVFGSNPEGRHGAGAAKYAKDNFGAIYGQGEGLQGQSYALPTKDLRIKANNSLRSISAEDITENIKKLYEVARQNPTKEFLVSDYSATNLNGYTGQEMADMFTTAGPIPSNIVFNENFDKLVGSTQPTAPVSTETVKAYRTSDTFSSKVDYAQRGSGLYYALDKPFQEMGADNKVEEVTVSYDPSKTLDATTEEGQTKFMDIKRSAIEGKSFKSMKESNDAVSEAITANGYDSLIGWIDQDVKDAGRELVIYNQPDGNLTNFTERKDTEEDDSDDLDNNCTNPFLGE